MQANSRKTSTASMLPSNLQQILQELGLPMPVGTDDNGLPFWEINGQTIYWAQMQQFIWLRQQQTGGKGGAGSVEKGPQFNSIDASAFNLPDVKIENNVEKGLEAGEKSPEAGFERAAENQAEQSSSESKKTDVATRNSNKSKTVVGDSVAVTGVDLTDTNDVNKYVQSHINDPVSSSSRFMAEVLRKVLRALSLG